eukprot:jgi/Tetstr1/441669/TSEL_029894.t1
MQDGYYALSLQEDVRDYFTINVRGTLLRFAALPMGWSLSPYYFCILMAVMVRYLRQPYFATYSNYGRPFPRRLRRRKARVVCLLPLIDDFMFLAPSRQLALRLRAEMAGRGGQCCLLCLHEMNKQDAPLDPDAPCIKCEGHLRPPVALLEYMDYAANARQVVYDVLRTKSMANPRLRGAADSASAVLMQNITFPLQLLQRCLEDVMAQVHKMQSTRLSDAADGPAEVFNQEPQRNMWLKLHQKRG